MGDSLGHGTSVDIAALWHYNLDISKTLYSGPQGKNDAGGCKAHFFRFHHTY